jgi:hypothetical protein
MPIQAAGTGIKPAGSVSARAVVIRASTVGAEQLVRVDSAADRATRRLTEMDRDRRDPVMDWAELQRQAAEINAAERETEA